LHYSEQAPKERERERERSVRGGLLVEGRFISGNKTDRVMCIDRRYMIVALTNITGVIRPGRKIKEGECTRLWGRGEVSVGKSEGKRPLQKPRNTWEDN